MIAPATREKLDAVLPPTWSGSNPVDIVGDAGPDRYAAALEALLADSEQRRGARDECSDRDRFRR